jgi:aryl-alcohol dehydrogenase-like predicted oxidoreductase
MSHVSRRSFLKGALAAGGTLALGAPAATTTKRLASDWVTLGNSGVKVTRLAFGTGTFGGRVQRELGQEEFTKLVRHAYDRGIRFFETADAYTGMPQMLATALKGVPRDSYRLMTKMRVRDNINAAECIERFRKDLNTDYFDVLLLHAMRIPNWVEEYKPARDVFSEAKEKKLVMAHGASCHGLLPLRRMQETKWLDVALLRCNHNGTRMDTVQGGEGEDKGDVPEVTSRIQTIRAGGTGVIGMKLVGEGRFKNAEDRDAAMKHAFDRAGVNAVTIGYKSIAEIDEAVERMNRVLNS